MSKIDLSEIKCAAYGVWLFDENATNSFKMYQRTENIQIEEISVDSSNNSTRVVFNLKTSLDGGDLFNERQSKILNVSKMYLI